MSTTHATLRKPRPRPPTHRRQYFETSAKEATNVDEAFQHVARASLKQEAEVELFADYADPIRLQQAGAAGGSSNCAC